MSERRENESAAAVDAAPGRLASSGLERYLPLAAWGMVVLCLLFIALKIIGYGFLPGGDARRHVARAMTVKPISEIIVARPEYSMDHSAGWEALLRALHRHLGWTMDNLMTFSIVALLLCVFFAPLRWMRRPEAWLAALLAETVVNPELMYRLTQARPFLLTEGVLIAVLFSWSRLGNGRPSLPQVALTWVGISLSVWMHGAWYLWLIPLAGFCLARAWRAAAWLGGCWVAGTLAGAALTGAPLVFLKQAIFIASTISADKVPQWMLVGEFRPGHGEFGTVMLTGLMLLWRRQRGRENAGLWSQPAFWMMIICWVAGFKACRFWVDWGVPAFLAWLAMEFDDAIGRWHSEAQPRRLLACGLIAVPLFLNATNDIDRRYSSSLSEVFLDGSDPELQGWMPEGKGIFYAADMDFFFNTFYKNPKAEWRYILAYEPALMPPEDLMILRRIQFNRGVLKAYEPWIAKMRPEDRLVIIGGARPNLSALEWRNAAGNIWIGRFPRAARPSNDPDGK